MSISTDNIIDSYFDRKNILVKHQIESFDNLMYYTKYIFQFFN